MWHNLRSKQINKHITENQLMLGCTIFDLHCVKHCCECHDQLTASLCQLIFWTFEIKSFRYSMRVRVGHREVLLNCSCQWFSEWLALFFFIQVDWTQFLVLNLKCKICFRIFRGNNFHGHTISKVYISTLIKSF